MKKIILIAMMVGIIGVGSLNAFAADNDSSQTVQNDNTTEWSAQCNPNCPYSVADGEGGYTCGNTNNVNGTCRCNSDCSGLGSCANGGVPRGNGYGYRGCRNR